MPPQYNIQNLFQSINLPNKGIGSNQYGPSTKTLTKGSLIAFNYMFWKHDAYPLIIITDILPKYIRGVNLHYLTFPYIKRLLQPNCNNPSFSYYNIKLDRYLVSSFRTYKRQGIRSVKKFDCSFLLNIMKTVRSFDINELDNIRRFVQDQMSQQINPTADQIQKQQQE